MLYDGVCRISQTSTATLSFSPNNKTTMAAVVGLFKRRGSQSQTNSTPTAIALGIKSHRVYGLTSRAWRGPAPQDDAASPSVEAHRRRKILEAIRVALSEDAGGFGTVGFHLVRFILSWLGRGFYCCCCCCCWLIERLCSRL
jgi:hypothetical protein